MTREQFEEEIKEIEALTWYRFTPIRKEILYKTCHKISSEYFREKTLECLNENNKKTCLQDIINKITA